MKSSAKTQNAKEHLINIIIRNHEERTRPSAIPGLIRNPQSAIRNLFAILALLALAGCGGPVNDDGTGPASQHRAMDDAAVPLAWRADKSAVRLLGVRAGFDNVQVDLVLPAGSPTPSGNVEFNLCLPDRHDFKLKIRRYAVGLNVVQELDRLDHLTTRTAQQRPLEAAQTLALNAAGVMRDTAIWRLSINENFWRPWTALRGGPLGDLTATIEIHWTLDATQFPATPSPPAGIDRGMRRVLRHLVANSGDIGRWTIPTPNLQKEINAEPREPRQLALTHGAWFRMRIAHDGLYRLTAADLARAGLTTTTALARVRLFTAGKAVPVWREKVAGTDALLFYGWKSRTVYDPAQVYWLALADTPEPAAPAADPATLRGPAHAVAALHKRALCDRDNVLKLASDEFGRIMDSVWVDRKLLANQPTSVVLTLRAPLPLAPQTKLKAVFKFFPEGEPTTWNGTEAELRHDGVPLAQFTFTPNPDSFERRIELPATALAAGVTTLTLVVTKETTATLPLEDSREGIWLDSAEVAYDGAPTLEDGRLMLSVDTVTTATSGTLYRVSLGAPAIPAGKALVALDVNPQTLDARRLPLAGDALSFHLDHRWHGEVFDAAVASAPSLEASAWQDDILTDDGTEVLILTHASFMETVKPLAELHRRKGLKSRVIDVQQIYDLFGGGMLSPLAIRDFLGYTALHWKGGLPQYLLLFGDCTEDYLGHYRSTVKNLVPSYTYTIGEEKWPADYWYSLVVGEDSLPDLMVSRISVGTQDDAKAVIDKTIRYSEKQLGAWRGRISFVSDNVEDYRPMTERARTENTPPTLETPHIYLDELPLEDNWYISQSRLDKAPVEDAESMRKVSGEATNAIKDLLNSGTPLLEYTGHGSPNLWAHERIWFGGNSAKRDAQYLKSDGRYAFIITYTCATGKIDYPIEPWNVCISEDFLRQADGGAIGLFAPSGLGSLPMQEVMMRQWHAAIFQDRLRPLGELATLVRARYAADQASETHLLMYHLLGDPTANLQMVEDWRPLEVTPKAAQPGAGRVMAALHKMEPAAGKAKLWIENEHGDSLWEGEAFDYSGGAIEREVPLPTAQGSPQRLRLALYAWNEQEKRDLMAGGFVTLERPAVAIRAARARREGEQVRFEVDLENTAHVDAGECKVKVSAVGEAEGAALAELTIELAAGEHKTVALTAAVASAKGPLCFEALVATPQPADNPAQGFPARRRFVLAPQNEWTGWVPALGGWLAGGKKGDMLTLCAASTAQTAGHGVLLRPAPGNAGTTFTLKFESRDGLFFTSHTMPLGTGRRMLATTASLVLFKDAPGKSPEAAGRMTPGELPRYAPRLRIDPQSIAHHPAAPTDGETVFVTFTVENLGNATARPCQPALLSKPLAEGGKRLPFRSALANPPLPELGPGRLTTVTLRWDPEPNAGVQTVTIDLNPAPGRQASELNDQTAPYRLYVRTKSRLAIGRKLPPLLAENELGKGGVKLRVEVLNEGETDARNVEVTYYRTPEKKPENTLGPPVLLKLVPAQKNGVPGSAMAVLGCKVNEATDHPVVEVRVKGAAQSITN